MHKYLVIGTIITAVLAPWGRAAVKGEPMKPWKSIEGDRDRSQRVVVTEAKHTYEVVLDAAVDGVMTRMPVGYAAYRQGWQPNRVVRLENVGDTDVVNPWLIVNGKRRWRTLDEMAGVAVGNWTSDGDKARAVWEFTRHHRFHATTWCNEVNDAVKVFNVYGYTLCGNDAQIISDVWHVAGLKTRRGFPVGHCVAEVFYDGEFHLLDGDEHCIYLRRDNLTIAPEAEIVRDHDLIKRTHTYGVLQADSRSRDEFSASLFGYEGERKGRHGGRTKHTMAFTLRPREWIEWRWDHVGKEYTAGAPAPGGKWRKDGEGSLTAWGSVVYAKLRNGKLNYAPDLDTELARKGMVATAGLAPPAAGGLYPEAVGTGAHAIWRIASPYVIVGAKLSLRFTRATLEDSLTVQFSRDGKAWTEIWTPNDRVGAIKAELDVDELVSRRKRPDYQYFVKVALRAGTAPVGAALRSIEFDTDVQMSALALPELEAGRNTVAYSDETAGPRRVNIEHRWVERTSWHPPVAPVLRSPTRGTTVSGTDVDFAWEPAAHPDGTGIADYQIQLGEHEDMRWVLSPNFDKLLSRTAWGREAPKDGRASHTANGKVRIDQTRWTVPYTGLLNPDTTYYWRVRAQDANRVWGPWSDVGSFRCNAPGVPLEVRAHVDVAAQIVELTWKPNPGGATPVTYRVYASDEKGFTASDTPHSVRMGRGFCTTVEEYEKKGKVPQTVATSANFVAETSQRRFAVVAPNLAFPNANKSFYRVVAVDAAGRRSGSSDYAEAPRPFIYTRPASTAKVGKAFSHQPGVLASIGDFRSKRGYKAAFWNRERHTFAIAEGPDWLTIDVDTGCLGGTPSVEHLGKSRVVWRVADDHGRSAEQAIDLEVLR